MNSNIAKLLEKVVEQGGLTEMPQPSTSAIEEEIVTALGSYFQSIFKVESVSLKIPEDYLTFLTLLGDDAADVHFGGDYGTYVWSWEQVIKNTKYWADIDFYISEDESTSSKKEIWLHIGDYSDKHWYFLCCAPNSPNYGKVMDGHDNTPWNEYNALYREADSFTEFLSNLVSGE